MKNFSEYKKLLEEFVKFQSVSTDPKFKPEIEGVVLWIKELLTKSGFEVRILKGKKCNPVIFANYELNKKAKTLLIYGHYDVQPADRSDGWKVDPFKVLEAKGKFLLISTPPLN